jgi:hypothetical protein
MAVAPVHGQDDPRTAPVFDARFGVADVLKIAKENDKALTIVLRGGGTYTGKVKSVGAHAVVLTGLRGKEFFDAYVRMDAIAAMEERVRLR